MTARRRVPPPSTDLSTAAVFRGRYSQDDPSTDAPESTPSTPPTPDTGATGSTTNTPTTDATKSTRAEVSRRSFYMRPATEQRLTELIDDVHFKTRVPKVDVLAAIVEVAQEHADEVWRKVGG